ncbi:MAG: transcriptional regulator [Thaumarchaeota archaeon]|nr:MAG: transcriptional regulator [Nitrososphaerota archaeon]
MSKDQIIGGLLLAASIILAVVYLWALFFGADVVWMGITVRMWAIIIPVVAVVIGVLAIVGWIGYTLATTPPPEEITAFEEEEEEKKEEGK